MTSGPIGLGSAFYRPSVDTGTPNIARMYDYYLGGKNNFDADREAAEKVIAHLPVVRRMAQHNRHFLSQVVRLLTEEYGIRQFIDLGTGFPIPGSVHDIAQDVAPLTRVVYVDNDPVVLTHARALGVPNDNVTVLTADIREPQSILGSSDVRELIDFSEPVAVL